MLQILTGYLVYLVLGALGMGWQTIYAETLAVDYLISEEQEAEVYTAELEQAWQLFRGDDPGGALKEFKQVAFYSLANQYKLLHPDVEVKIQPISLRTYEERVTTQLIGGTVPDLIQVLRNSRNWAILTQHYIEALTPYIINENPYDPYFPFHHKKICLKKSLCV